MNVHAKEKRFFYITPDDFETAAQNGIPRNTVISRVNTHGWDIDRAITQPSRKKRVDYVTTWNEWKSRSKVSRNTFTARLRYGWTPEKAALTSVMKPGNYRKKLFTGEQMKIAESNGVSIRTAWHRYYVLGWSTEKAVSTPIMSRKESGRLGGKKKTGG